jgi:serine/threonine protein kinase
MDVATGLEFLHRCDIIHRDVKSENVLVFANPQFRYLARLSDFGSAMPGGQGIFDFLTQGTAIWAAPETLQGTYERHTLAASDTFSFGLMAWRVAIDGFDPLSVFMLEGSGSEALPHDARRRAPRTTINRLIETNQLAEEAASSTWITRYERLRETLILPDCGHKALSSDPASQPQRLVSGPEYFACLGQILHQCLQRLPALRSIQSAKSILEHLNGRGPK